MKYDTPRSLAKDKGGAWMVNNSGRGGLSIKIWWGSLMQEVVLIQAFQMLKWGSKQYKIAIGNI